MHRPPPDPLRGKEGGPGRILIVKLSALGDVAQALPVATSLRRRYPAACGATCPRRCPHGQRCLHAIETAAVVGAVRRALAQTPHTPEADSPPRASAGGAAREA